MRRRARLQRRSVLFCPHSSCNATRTCARTHAYARNALFTCSHANSVQLRESFVAKALHGTSKSAALPIGTGTDETNVLARVLRVRMVLGPWVAISCPPLPFHAVAISYRMDRSRMALVANGSLDTLFEVGRARIRYSGITWPHPFHQTLETRPCYGVRFTIDVCIACVEHTPVRCQTNPLFSSRQPELFGKSAWYATALVVVSHRLLVLGCCVSLLRGANRCRRSSHTPCFSLIDFPMH